MAYKNPDDEKAWRVRNREKINAAHRKWTREHPEQCKEHARRYYQKYKERHRVTTSNWQRNNRQRTSELAYKHTLKAYKLTLLEYNRLVEQQDGRCGICKKIPSVRLCVDHNHSTGEIRGLLCHDCNVGIGRLKDNPEFVYEAFRWLTLRDQYARSA